MKNQTCRNCGLLEIEHKSKNNSNAIAEANLCSKFEAKTQENIDENKYHPLLITGDFKGKLMSQAAKEFSKPDASKILAAEILKLA